ncbi:MAG: Asp23/Gls24 family envelope stress response protein [Clostridiales bacterium]|nr:Asp23/Gls24 family envelope stress response protein [Clostridiales bacterium]MCD8214105.1 Asp23/Gls24 family envelope stress response protein [Clostridiales bacterium]
MGENNVNISNIQITTEVISSIAATAALNVDGVAGLETSAVDGGFLSFLVRGRQKTVNGVAVKTEGSEVSLSMNIIAYFGYKLSEVGAEVQKSVKTAVENMAGMKVKKADINIVGLEKKKEAPVSYGGEAI